MRYLLQVSSRAMPGRDAEYNRWYDDIHVWDVLKLPGILACERSTRLVIGADGALSETEYVATYEVETDDPPGLLRSLSAAAATMTMTDAIDRSSARFEFLRPLGGRKQRKT